MTNVTNPPKNTTGAPKKKAAPKQKLTKKQDRNRKIGILVGVIVFIAIIIFVAKPGGIGGSSSSGNSSSTAGTASSGFNDTTANVKAYYTSNNKTYGSTANLTKSLKKSMPSATVIDANNFPTKTSTQNDQVAVMVSGGPLVAYGVYNSSLNGGKGACVYASSYAFGPGVWGYGVGKSGVPCGQGVKGSSALNTVKWSKTAPTG